MTLQGMPIWGGTSFTIPPLSPRMLSNLHIQRFRKNFFSFDEFFYQNLVGTKSGSLEFYEEPSGLLGLYQYIYYDKSRLLTQQIDTQRGLLFLNNLKSKGEDWQDIRHYPLLICCFLGGINNLSYYLDQLLFLNNLVTTLFQFIFKIVFLIIIAMEDKKVYFFNKFLSHNHFRHI